LIDNQRGFTLIEMLVVAAILGLLAAVAIPRFAATKQRAYSASMVSDLKNLIAAQEGFFSVYHDYANGVGSAEVGGPGTKGRIRFAPSQYNTLTVQRRAGAATGPGWTATVRNSRVTNKAIDICGIYVGNSAYTPNAAVKSQGIPACY